jgi:hypothetical protein
MADIAKTAVLAAALSLLLSGAALADGQLRLLPDPEQTARPAATATGPIQLVPFEQTMDAMRLVGEDDTRKLSFYLTEAQAKTPGSLRIAYHNAVSVLPDSAVMDVQLNGQPAGSFAIRSPNGDQLQELAVRPQQLVAGRNIVQLRARQHHRVDCSTEAVYELWTQLNPVLSGFASARVEGFSNVNSLLALARNPAGASEIRLIAPQGDRLAIARDSLKTIETMALFLNRPDIHVTVADRPGEGAGIDLYFGDTTTYPQTPQAQQLLADAPTGLSVRDAATPGRASVILHAGNPAGLSSALLAAVNGPMSANLQASLLAPKPETIAAGAKERFTLQDAGYSTAPFHGRLSRVSFTIDMPADFYPGDYGTVDFYLKGATAPGLLPGAQLLLRVNGKAAASYRFYNSEGETYDGRRRTELPLRAFHPGQNRVDILAELPMAGDRTCEAASRQDDTPRFILLDDSSIVIPPLAHIGRMPDLAAFSGAAYPFSDGKPFDVVVDRGDTPALEAALTLASRLALSARKPLEAVLRVRNAEQTGDRNALILTTAPDPHFAGLQSDPNDRTRSLDLIATSAITASPATPAPDSGNLLDAFQAKTALAENRLSWKSQFFSLIAKPLPAIRHWLNYEDQTELAAVVPASNVLVQLSQSPAPLGSATWTTVRASSPDALRSGVEALTAPTVWASLNGGSVILKTSDGIMVTRPASDIVFAEITDTSFSNLRRLAAAWLSDHFEIYVALVVLCLGGFGAWLGFFVPRKGIRTDQ